NVRTLPPSMQVQLRTRTVQEGVSRMSRSFRTHAVVLSAGVFAFVGGARRADAQTATAGQLLISEFRLRGPSGANDEFIEIYTNIGASHTAVAASGSGYDSGAS